MGFIIVGIILFGLGLFLNYNKFFWTKILGLYVGAVCVLVSLLVFLCNYFEYNLEYSQLVQNKQIIEYQERDSVAYTNIMKYNEAIRPHKEYADSFWFGIFYSKDIAELDYIEVD